MNSETPFQILLVGDFSGRQVQGKQEVGDRLAGREIFPLTRDNFDSVMTSVGVKLPSLATAGDGAEFHVGCFEDLHPDAIYSRDGLFGALRELRDRLQDPSTFQSAAAEVLQWGQAGSAEEEIPVVPAKPDSATSPAMDDATGVLDWVLETSEASLQQVAENDPWKQLIQQVALPYCLPATDPKLPELLSHVESVMAAMMRKILRHEAFRAIEAAWYSARMLIQRLETGTQLRVFLADISKPELAEDLHATDDLAQTGFYRFLHRSCADLFDGQPLAMIVGNYEFEASDSDASLLGRIAKISAAVQTTFVTGAATSPDGGSDPNAENRELEETAAQQLSGQFAGNTFWQALKELPEAACVSLVWPSYLVRLPYGAATRPIDAFDFEELTECDDDRQLLWGNAAVLVALALGDAFSEVGWALQSDSRFSLDDLPLYLRQSAHEQTQVVPCTGQLLDTADREALRRQHLLTVLAQRDTDQVHMLGMGSLFGTPLLGIWEA